MSTKKISLVKLKKKCQETLYQSLENNLKVNQGQTYIPAYTHVMNFDRQYSKKIFILNSKYVLLEILAPLEEQIEGDENDGERKSKIKIQISESLQGKVKGKIVNKNLYTRSKVLNDYQKFIAEVPIFIKSNPLLDVINYMEDKYELGCSTPSIFSYLTQKKINDINNNAYLEVICAYFLNLLQEKAFTSLFPHYYGSFNGLAESYVHDISEDYPHIRGCKWFMDKNEKLGFEIIRDNNLQDYQELSLKNVHTIDYDLEKDFQEKKKKELEINEIPEIDINLREELDLGEELDLEVTNLNLTSGEDNEIENKSQDSEDSDSNYSYSSDGSCIFSETYVKIKNFPIQVLAMECLDITLTKLIKKGIGIAEWKMILWEICFGLGVAQKHYGFIHNDLHSDNIMFKSCDTEFKYYQYQDKYYKVPTFGRETKVIDFARGIIKVGNKTYFSDVFKKEGDAGGQYNYLQKQKNKKYNFSFDLARLSTTIEEFIQNSGESRDLYRFVKAWSINKQGNSFFDMEDDFSLYVSIAESACQAIPKEQLEKPFFQEYQISVEDLDSKAKLYVF